MLQHAVYLAWYVDLLHDPIVAKLKLLVDLVVNVQQTVLLHLLHLRQYGP